MNEEIYLFQKDFFFAKHQKNAFFQKKFFFKIKITKKKEKTPYV